MRVHRDHPSRAVPGLVVALALVASGCGGPAADATITGVVLKGPLCPVVQEGQPCPDAPTAATVRVLDPASGDLLATADAGADGAFTVAVRAGDVRLEATAEGTLTCTPVDATVAPLGTTEVVVSCDTGIR